MNDIVLKIVVVLTILLIFLIGYIVTRKIERFVTEAETTKQTNLENIEYISCVAFDRSKSKSEQNNPDNKPILERAPFRSLFITAKTKHLILTRIMEVVRSVADQNSGAITGPVYMLMGRNKQLHQTEAWVYMPGMDKEGAPIIPEKIIMYNNWLRSLLFSKLYAVSDWLCNDACDEDLKPKEYKEIKKKKKELKDLKEDEPLPTSRPECGCISNKACPFYNIPRGFSAKPRNIKNISSYSIYKIRPIFFTDMGIKLTGNEYLDISKAADGSKLYSGCDTRLLSNNRLFAFEIDKNGAGVYTTEKNKPFHESCVMKPGEDSIDKSKVLKNRFDTIGTLPRLNIQGNDISLISVNTNKKTKRKELVKQWTVPTDGNKPYIFSIDDNGELKLEDNIGNSTFAEFEKV